MKVVVLESAQADLVELRSYIVKLKFLRQKAEFSL